MIPIKNYKPLLLCKQGDQEVVDTNERWGIVVQQIPFKLLPDVKEYARTEWKDADGDDEFIPAIPRFKAYEMEVTFLCIAPHGQAHGRIRAFWDYVKAGELMLHDTYTGIARRRVRYAKFAPKALRRRSGQQDAVEFKMTFKVNDPVTEVDLTRESYLVTGPFPTFATALVYNAPYYLDGQRHMRPWTTDQPLRVVFSARGEGLSGRVSGGPTGLTVEGDTVILMHTPYGGTLALTTFAAEKSRANRMEITKPGSDKSRVLNVTNQIPETVTLTCPPDAVAIYCSGCFTIERLQFTPDYIVRADAS